MLEKLSDEKIVNIIRESNSIKEVIEKMGLSPIGTPHYNKIKNIIKKYNINIDHFYLKKSDRCVRKIATEEILVEKSTYSNINGLKKRLIDEGILKNYCYECGIKDIWNNKKIVLQLEHVNGNKKDNRIENLKILCPNCHSQTSTFAGKNRKLMIKKYKLCCNCGRKLSYGNKFGYCIKCIRKNQILKTIEKNYTKQKKEFNINIDNLKELVKTESLKTIENKLKIKEWNIRRICKDNNIIIPHKSKFMKKFDVSKDDLIDLILKNNFCKIGRIFCVSDNAIRKRCETMGIDYKNIRGGISELAQERVSKTLGESH